MAAPLSLMLVGVCSAMMGFTYWRWSVPYNSWVSRRLFGRDPSPRALDFSRWSGAAFFVLVAMMCFVKAAAALSLDPPA